MLDSILEYTDTAQNVPPLPNLSNVLGLCTVFCLVHTAWIQNPLSLAPQVQPTLPLCLLAVFALPKAVAVEEKTEDAVRQPLPLAHKC